MFGDIAGVYELIVGVCGILLYSLSKHRFVLNAISKLFLINTNDPDLIHPEFYQEKD